MAKKTKKKRARQIRLPGMKDVTDPEIAKAGEKFRKSRDKAKDASDQRKADEQALIAVCERKGLEVYRDMEADPPIVIKITTTKHALVKPIPSGEVDESGPPEADEREPDVEDDDTHEGGDPEPTQPPPDKAA